MAAPLRLVIDEERCTGHGRCYALAPDLFDADDVGRGVVTLEAVPDGLVEQARRAVAGCPEAAVALHEG
jgi:ferredoxin